MGKIIVATLLAASFLVAPGAFADDDNREFIKIPAESRALLLSEMRTLTEHLDDVLAALSEGDFKEVAKIADFNLGFGHNKFTKMLEDGVSLERIEVLRRKMMRWRAQGGKSHGDGDGGIFGKGVGRLLPEAVRDMGQQLHAAAADVSTAAKAVDEKPTVENYKAVLEAVQQMTSTCRACHASFRIQ